jgi:3-oxoacyl-[acyl-carrier-protein] synthase II
LHIIFPVVEIHGMDRESLSHNGNPMESKRRVVITGLGVVSAVGNSVPLFWNSLKGGRDGIRPITLFETSGLRTHNGGEVIDLPVDEYFSPKEKRRLSRCDQFGLIAAEEAMEASGFHIGKVDRERFGIILGAGSGGILSVERYFKPLYGGTERRPSPLLLISFSLATTTDCIASRFDLHGPRTTAATVCSSSSAAIAFAYESILAGWADIMLSGGSDSLCEVSYTGFNSLRLVDPEYCKPFDKEREGLSLGEGAGILILEEMNHALSRGADIVGELLGYGVCADAYHLTSPEPHGEGIARAISTALRNAAVAPSEIDYINAHGTGTIFNDVAETEGIKKVFRREAYSIPISSIKSMVGHCLGSAGAIEAISTLLTIREGIIPPTIHYRVPDPLCDLNYTPNEAARRKVDLAISNSFAFGGNNVCLVLGKWVDQETSDQRQSETDSRRPNTGFSTT